MTAMKYNATSFVTQCLPTYSQLHCMAVYISCIISYSYIQLLLNCHTLAHDFALASIIIYLSNNALLVEIVQ